jgi:hypothetical protein
MRWAGHVDMGEMRNAYKMLVGKSDEKNRPSERP